MEKLYSQKELSLALKTLQLYFEISNEQICDQTYITIDKYYRLTNGYDKIDEQILDRILSCYLIDFREFMSNNDEIKELFKDYITGYVFEDKEKQGYIVQKIKENEDVFESSMSFYIVLLLRYVQKVRIFDNASSERKIILKIYPMMEENYKAVFNLFYSLELRRKHQLEKANQRIMTSLNSCVGDLKNMLLYHKIIIKLKRNDLINIQNDFDLCKTYFLQEHNFDRYLEMTCHEAIYYVKLCQYNIAIDLFNTALLTAEREGKTHLKNIIKDNIVWVFILKKEYQSALDYTDESFTEDIACFHKSYLFNKLGNIEKSNEFINIALSRNLNNRSILIKLIRYVSVLNSGKKEKIFKYLQSLEQLLIDTNKYDIEDLIFIYNELIDFLENNEQYKEATIYYRKLFNIIC
ncbi:hypothetical protein [Holdemania filiformis]|uniref:hypothetical protein n=1 Tax=Holdemania filiformis TaxID=61171 RepID=UPI00243153C3|nr:hypothetical protein [Holdemania filiformis]